MTIVFGYEAVVGQDGDGVVADNEGRPEGREPWCVNGGARNLI